MPVTLNLDVLIVVMAMLPTESLNSMMQTCKLLHAVGLPLLIQSYESERYDFSLVSFLRFLLVNPAVRAPCLRTLTMTEDHGFGIFRPDFPLESPEGNEIRKMLEQILVHAHNLVRLHVNRCDWLFGSSNLVVAALRGCRALTHLYISTKPSWNVAYLMSRFDCPLRSFNLHFIEPSLECEIVLGVEAFVLYADTLERLEISGARLSPRPGYTLQWPRVNELRCRVEQDVSFLASSFPNVKIFSLLYSRYKANAAGHDTTTWSNLDRVILPPVAYTLAPRCPARLFSTWITSPYFDLEQLTDLLSVMMPLVLDVDVPPDVPPPVVKEILQATRQTRCLRLTSRLKHEDDEDAAAPIAVCKIL
jgi:hypothetical protein